MSLSDSSEPAERRPDWAALFVAAFLIALAAVVAWDVAHMRTGVATYSRIGPRAFPVGIAIGLAGLGVLTAIMAFRARAPELERDEVAPMVWIVGGLVVQIALLPIAGFSIATGAVFAATARAFGRGPLWLTYPAGVAGALAIWLFFSKALKLVLPAGPLERLF
ncbi:MAG: tripartite tricarboxylate transporter TctB family protein [Propylenella sp.]